MTCDSDLSVKTSDESWMNNVHTESRVEIFIYLRLDWWYNCNFICEWITFFLVNVVHRDLDPEPLVTSGRCGNENFSDGLRVV